MDPKETTQSLMSAIQKADFEKARSLLTDDFVFSGPIPEPINGAEWLGVSANLKAAFPDLDYQFRVEGANGNVVNIVAKLKGTHKGSLDLSNMGLGVIPPTHKSFVAAQEHGKVTVQGDKISALANEPTEGAGLIAILDQLGVRVPTV